MVECIFFYLNMVAQTQWNLISPLCDKNVSRLLLTSGFNVKVLKINLMAFHVFFTISICAQLWLVVIDSR